MQEDLKKLGLTDNEIKVYLSLLKIGETSVGGIIDNLKIHRQIAYNALDSLEQKNMVIKTMKNKIYHFKTSDPEIIVENIQSQEIIAKRLSKQIKVEMKKSKHESSVNIYSGRTQLRNYYIKIFSELPAGSSFQIYSGHATIFIDVFGEDFILGKYADIRKRRKLKSQLLASEVEREKQIKIHEVLDPSLREYKFLPFVLSNPITTIILEDSIFYCFFSDIKDAYIIEIKNKDLRDSFYQNFQLLWKIAKK